MQYELVSKEEAEIGRRRNPEANWVDFVLALPSDKVAKIKCDSETDIKCKGNSIRVAGYRLGIPIATSSRILDDSFFIHVWRK